MNINKLYLLVLVFNCTMVAAGGYSQEEVEIIITKERRALDYAYNKLSDDGCKDLSSSFYLKEGDFVSEKLHFTFNNHSGEAVFIELIKDRRGYRTHYPVVELFYYSEEKRDWVSHLSGAGTFDFTGVRSLQIKPNGQVSFSTTTFDLKNYGNLANKFRLRMQIFKSPKDPARDCVVSREFVHEVTDPEAG